MTDNHDDMVIKLDAAADRLDCLSEMFCGLNAVELSAQGLNGFIYILWDIRDNIRKVKDDLINS